MRLGDAVIGTGEVADPVPEGGQEFKFEVDDALFASNPELSLALTIDGFANNAVALTDQQRKMLDQAAESLAKCSIVVTGYSSAIGPDLINKRVSMARAQAVADYLAASKTPPAAIDVVASGATDRFGEALAANRRVVVELTK